MEDILKTEEFEAHTLTWLQLKLEAEIQASDRTIQRTINIMNYHKCFVCQWGWVNNSTAERCFEFTTHMLQKYPSLNDWKCVQFHDEVHFDWGSQDKLHIIQKSEQHYCNNCLQKCDMSADKNLKQKHCWAAVSYNFKSDIHFYDVSENSNEKMSMIMYHD